MWQWHICWVERNLGVTEATYRPFTSNLKQAKCVDLIALSKVLHASNMWLEMLATNWQYLNIPENHFSLEWDSHTALALLTKWQVGLPCLCWLRKVRGLVCCWIDEKCQSCHNIWKPLFYPATGKRNQCFELVGFMREQCCLLFKEINVGMLTACVTVQMTQWFPMASSCYLEKKLLVFSANEWRGMIAGKLPRI